MPSTIHHPTLDALLRRAETVLERLEHLLPPAPIITDWSAPAFLWRPPAGPMQPGGLQAIHHPHRIRLDDLQGIESQKQRILDNTRQFVQGLPANNVLLTGARGTGKSSLVKAVLQHCHHQGLRLIEVERHALIDLPRIVDNLADRPERFILYCDDLSFAANDPGYKTLKSALDGSVSGTSEHVLIYATSNRRHLMPESMSENLQTRISADGEIHPGETTEEKISLSERFGIWLSFLPFSQDQFLTICDHWLQQFGIATQHAASAHPEALRWALSRGSRSGRVAWQFARDYAGRQRMEAMQG